MKNTTNYGFKLPEQSDFYDIEHMNANFSEVDKKLKEHEDGTTPVGNANKLGGKLPSEFTSYNPTVLEGENGLLTEYANSPNGIHMGECSRVTIASVGMTYARGVYIIQKDNGYGMITFFANGDIVKKRYVEHEGWAWERVSDGGNADTVDGLHAIDLIKSGGRVSILGFDGEYDLYANIDGGKYSIPYGWTRASLQADLAKYLPLDGSVPMSGALQLANGNSKLNGSSAYIELMTGSNTANARYLVLRNSTHAGGAIHTCLQVHDTVDGQTTAYNVLHTGNSAKVVVSNTPLTAEGSVRVW